MGGAEDVYRYVCSVNSSLQLIYDILLTVKRFSYSNKILLLF